MTKGFFGPYLRRTGLPLLILVLISPAGCGVNVSRPFTVGILNHAAVAEDSIRGFKDVMSERGLRSGDEIVYLYRGAVLPEELEGEASRLVEEGADLILSITMPATVAALRAGVDKSVPVVFAPNSNPVGAGIVSSMDRPGGNVTGVSFWIQEDKRLEWLTRIVPGVKRVMVPYMDWDRSPRIEIHKLEEVADKLGVTIIGVPIDHPGMIPETAGAIPEEIDAVFIPADALIESNAPLFIEHATARGIPVTSPQSFGFQSGALFAFGFVQYETGRQGAVLALQIMDGQKAGDLPVELAETRLMINLKAAESLGLEIPREIIATADMVIR